MGLQRLALPGARPQDEHLNEHLIYGPEVIGWLDRFMKLWSGLEDEAKTVRS